MGCQLAYQPGKGPKSPDGESRDEFRCPLHGDTKPEIHDTSYHSPLTPDYLFSFAVNGWNWNDLKSEYVTFDLDSIVNHAKGLSPEKIQEIIDKIKAIPWTEIIKSKSGHGYHIRIYFDPPPHAATHNHHQINGQRALAYLSQVTGLDLLQDDIDVCGAMAFIWHKDTASDGLRLIKDSTQKLDLSLTPEIEIKPKDNTEYPPVKLTAKHKEAIAFFKGKGYPYNEKTNRLITHAAVVAQAHEELGWVGDYETIATGRIPGDKDCWLVPLANGAWIVYRYTKGCKEHESWFTTKNGWTACFVNRKEKKKKGDDPSKIIVDDALSQDKFFKYQGMAYVEVNNEILQVKEERYGYILRIRLCKKLKLICKAEWLKNAIEHLSAIAMVERSETPIYVRMAYHNHNLYIDIGDDARTIYVVDGDGYRITQDVPVKFYRSANMQPLALPKAGGTLKDLQQFVNIASEDWPLFVGALLGIYQPNGTRPIIALIGGDGHCKTSLALLILSLLDPSVIKGRSIPVKMEDLMLAARQCWILFFDNLSDMPEWFSNALCQISSGGSLERRTLFKNADTTVITIKRPVITTSIKDVFSKNPDLIARTLKFELPKIPKVKTEEELEELFNAKRAEIFGAFLTVISTAIKNLPEIQVDDLPRLADFAKWVSAAEPATELKKDSILKTYKEIRETAIEEILSGDKTQKIITLSEIGFNGTGKELSEKLNLTLTDREIQEFVSELRILQSTLESQNVSIRFYRSNGKKQIEIKKVPHDK
jgi:hypothetical protein